MRVVGGDVGPKILRATSYVNGLRDYTDDVRATLWDYTGDCACYWDYTDDLRVLRDYTVGVRVCPDRREGGCLFTCGCLRALD